MDWFYYIMGKIFFWGMLVLIIGGIGYYLGYNHTKLPVIKDFSIVRNEELKRPIPSASKKKEIVTNTPEASQSATASAATKTPTPKE